MFRRDPETRKEWSEEKAEGCAARQREILSAAALMVRPGGRLVYSTCTYNPSENEKSPPPASFFIYSPFVLRMMPAMDLGGVIS